MNLAIATSGILITEEVAFKLKQAGLDYVQISIEERVCLKKQSKG
jgi:MoaA/NifB/PqqE/SkfB family radical SAM enzyme